VPPGHVSGPAATVMNCAACSSPDAGIDGWFTTWKGEAICSPCSQRGLGGDMAEIDRYAVEQLPDEVAPVHSWVVDMRDTVLDESSEWSEKERAQLAPGLNFLVEMIEHELQEATEALAYVRERMDAPPPQLLVDGLRSPSSPRDPEWEQVRVRTAVRATIPHRDALNVRQKSAFATSRVVVGPASLAAMTQPV
jgi:hypothetical protein